MFSTMKTLYIYKLCMYGCILYVCTYSLNISSLREPPDCLQIREVKDCYVELLMKMLEGNEDGYDDYGELTARYYVQ